MRSYSLCISSYPMEIKLNDISNGMLSTSGQIDDAFICISNKEINSIRLKGLMEQRMI